MENLIEYLKTDNYLLVSFIINILLIVLLLVNLVITIVSIIKYKTLMKKLGNGNNLDEMLRGYLKEVERISKENKEIENYYIKLDNDLDSCIQKVGLVRFNAFKDVGSDLSFALALLDRNDNGVVLNGLYGSESSNIYSKPVKKGESSYVLSDEERYAIDIADQKMKFYTKTKKPEIIQKK
jgi:hypothetical protein